MAFSGNYVSDNPATALFIKIYIALYIGQFALSLLLIGAAYLITGFPGINPQVMGAIVLAVPCGLFIFFQTQHSKVLRSHLIPPESDQESQDLD